MELFQLHLYTMDQYHNFRLKSNTLMIFLSLPFSERSVILIRHYHLPVLYKSIVQLIPQYSGWFERNNLSGVNHH